MPPCLANAIAISDSVTVSIAALITGIFKVIFFVRLVEQSTSLGRTDDLLGTNKTSSNVNFFSTLFDINISGRYLRNGLCNQLFRTKSFD